jgi:hypothetical protein
MLRDQAGVGNGDAYMTVLDLGCYGVVVVMLMMAVVVVTVAVGRV